MKCQCGCGEEAVGNRKFKHGHIKKYVENHKGTPCACGCGKLVFPTENSLFPIYIKGHSRRGTKHTQETKDKITGSVNKWFEHNEFTSEQREAMGAPSRGVPRHAYSPEMRAKTSKSVKEYWETHSHSEESLEIIKQANLRSKRSDETKKKMSEQKKGDKNPAKRPEVRRAISEGQRTSPLSQWFSYTRLCDGKEVLLQGQRELDFAKKLDELEVEWKVHSEFEPSSYEQDGRWSSYSADFYLPISKQHVDVKSTYYSEPQRKIEAVRKSNPDIDLVILCAHEDDAFFERLTVQQSNQ